MPRVATVLSRQIVNVAIIVYCIGFWRSASQLPDGPAVVYPQLIIVALAIFIVADVVSALARRTHEVPVEEAVAVPSAAGAATAAETSADDAGTDGTEDVAAETERSLGEAARDIWREQQKIVVTAVATLVTIRLISVLGFYTAIGIFLGVMYWYLGMRRPLTLSVLWVGSLAVAWGLFTVLLGVRLPTGTFI